MQNVLNASTSITLPVSIDITVTHPFSDKCPLRCQVLSHEDHCLQDFIHFFYSYFLALLNNQLCMLSNDTRGLRKTLVLVVVACSWQTKTLMHQHDLSQFVACQTKVVDLLQTFFLFFLTSRTNPSIRSFGMWVEVRSTIFSLDTNFFRERLGELHSSSGQLQEVPYHKAGIQECFGNFLLKLLEFFFCSNSAEHEAKASCSTLKFYMDWSPRCLHQTLEQTSFPSYFLQLPVFHLPHFQHE